MIWLKIGCLSSNTSVASAGNSARSQPRRQPTCGMRQVVHYPTTTLTTKWKPSPNRLVTTTSSPSPTPSNDDGRLLRVTTGARQEKPLIPFPQGEKVSSWLGTPTESGLGIHPNPYSNEARPDKTRLVVIQGTRRGIRHGFYGLLPHIGNVKI